MTQTADIILVVNGTSGVVDPVTYEMLAFAMRLQTLGAGHLQVWVLGESADGPAHELAREGGVDAMALQCPGMSHYYAEGFLSILAPILRTAAPTYVVTAHTSSGAEWAPAVAARLEAGCIGGIDGLGLEDGRIWFSKDRYGGKVKGRFVTDAATTVLTVQPGCFKFEGRPEGNGTGQVTVETIAWKTELTRFQGVVPATGGTINLADAAIIVAAGNGIGDEENLQLIHQLAARLPKAMVAGTRIVCDRGWLGYDRQVGVTGATVAPALYIACGISGASQHVQGMRGSGFVIAINTDPQAAICAEADVCVVEDLKEFIPVVLEICGKPLAKE
jgi:electron transfer flavoprotein alpha subunit